MTTVIDAHAHIYPTKIADRAVNAIGDFYSVGMSGGGTSEDLLAATADTPISRYIVHSVATTAHAVESINTFIAGECEKHPEFIGFMAMHQDYDDPAREIERAVSLGLRGMKLHPDTQEVNMDDPRLMEVYAILEEKHLPLVVHTGDYRKDYSHPRRLVNILRTFPELVVDAAHFGGWSIPEIAYDLLHEERCFVDASSSMRWLGQRRTRELARLFGCDRVMFGSDYPMWDPAAELEEFLGCGFTDDELDLMLHENAERFVGER